MADADQRAQQVLALAVAVDSRDQRAVELRVVERQAAQRGQRGLCRAAVVDPDVDPQRAQRLHQRTHAVGVAGREVLGHLQAQARAARRGLAGEPPAQPAQEVRVARRGGGHVHRDPLGALEAHREVLQHLLQDHHVQRAAEAQAHRDRHEAPGRQQRAVPATQARQHLQVHQPAVAGQHRLRLQHHVALGDDALELVLPQRLVVQLRRRHGRAGLPQVPAPGPAVFGVAQRRLAAIDQRGRVVVAGHDHDAGVHALRAHAVVTGRRQRRDQLLGEGAGRGLRRARQHDAEDRPAPAPERGGLVAHPLREPGAHRAHERIAALVAAAAVDRVQAANVEQHERGRPLVAGLPARERDVHQQRTPVAQPRHRVQVGLCLQLARLLALIGDELLDAARHEVHRLGDAAELARARQLLDAWKSPLGHRARLALDEVQGLERDAQHDADHHRCHEQEHRRRHDAAHGGLPELTPGVAGVAAHGDPARGVPAGGEHRVARRRVDGHEVHEPRRHLRRAR